MRSARWPVAAFSLLAILAAAGCGGGGSGSPIPDSPTTGAIEGYVFARSRSRAPGDLVISRSAEAPSGTTALSGASVTLSPTGRSTATTTDQSGNGGYFRIAELAPGAYTVTISATGYADTSFAAQVTAGVTTAAGSSDGQTVLEPAGPTRRKWTFLVYMNAANDLEEYGILNMNQMESVGSTSDVNIVVQFKRMPGYDATNGNWTGCRRYLVTKDSSTSQISSTMLADLGDVDMGSPATLQQFIAWGTEQYPADHTCLVLWNHGAGWRSTQLPDGAPSRGILFDDQSGSFMTMPELNSGLSGAGFHFDLIAIDACMMSMVETVYEIKDRADYLAVAEGSPPGTGYPYDTILAKLAATPSMTPESLGRIFVSDTIARYSSYAATQTLIRTSGIATLIQKVNDFATALSAAMPNYQSQIGLARSRTQSYDYTYYRDLYDFASNVKSNVSAPAVSSAATAVMDALPAANGGPILAEGHNLTDTRNSHGISIYLPAVGQYYSGYSDLRFTKDYPKWYDFILGLSGA